MTQNYEHSRDLGDVYHKLKRYDEAIDAYRQVLRINPEDASALKILSLIKRYK